MDMFSRAEMLLGGRAIERLSRARVAIFGIGGVGGYVAEALARCAVGGLDLIDADVVTVSNINRQITALHSTLGRPKAEVMRARILDINPRACVTAHICFYSADTAGLFDLAQFDYVVDAVDTVTAKLLLAERACAAGVPIISSMGAGNKLTGAFEVADISQTSVCPLARVMRRELAARGIRRLKVVYSREQPRPVAAPGAHTPAGRPVPASVSFAPPAAGLCIAGEVVRELCGMTG